MATIYSPTQAGRILAVMTAVDASNNGQCVVPDELAVLEALRAAGYVVTMSTDLHGRLCRRAYSPRGWEAANAAARAFPRRPARMPMRHTGPDYEGAILARQEAAGYFD